MEGLFVGPFIIWVLVCIWLVKKKGRQWPDLMWGWVGGMIMSVMFNGLGQVIYNSMDGLWEGIVNIFQSMSQGG